MLKKLLFGIVGLLVLGAAIAWFTVGRVWYNANQAFGRDTAPADYAEIELRKAGALYESATAFRDVFATHVVVDEEQRFVTGQNQNSGRETAHAMMKLIAKRS